VVAERCRGLQIPHFQRVFLSAGCLVLHRIALPVVSEWCQYHPRICLRLRVISSRYSFVMTELVLTSGY
jgi:hypothetical protein